MTGHAVVIAGGGPTGMMLAGELALAGVDVAIVERRASQQLDGSRSGGLHSRAIEVLDQRGIAGRFLSEGRAMQIQGFAGIRLDISDFPTRHNYGLALPQIHWAGSWPRRSRGHRAKTCWTPTMPSGTRLLPAYCRTPWRKPRSPAATIGSALCATPCPSCWEWTSRANGSPQ
jgi:choline dehydrogenase-like flavoprotein